MRRMRKLARLFWEMLREIGDERAYERHLAAHHRPHSAAEWRRFSGEAPGGQVHAAEVLLKGSGRWCGGRRYAAVRGLCAARRRVGQRV